jgi:hypothetical protein
MPAFFNFILAHSGDAADPELVHWIKERLDQVFGPSPWVLVIVIGAIIFAIPILVIGVYLTQGGRRAAVDRPNRPKINRDWHQDGQEQE